MVRHRPGSAPTKRSAILGIARALFVERGIAAVSVREIAATAGVDHALVHYYFGSREGLIDAVIARELEAASEVVSTAPPDPADPYPELRAALRHFLGDGRSTLVLIARAELAGLAPEARLGGGSFRPLRLMAENLAVLQARSEGGATGRADPAIVSAVVGAAMFGLATLAPWLTSAVGLAPEDAEARRDELIEVLVGMIAAAAGPVAGG